MGNSNSAHAPQISRLREQCKGITHVFVSSTEEPEKGKQGVRLKALGLSEFCHLFKGPQLDFSRAADLTGTTLKTLIKLVSGAAWVSGFEQLPGAF